MKSDGDVSRLIPPLWEIGGAEFTFGKLRPQPCCGTRALRWRAARRGLLDGFGLASVARTTVFASVITGLRMRGRSVFASGTMSGSLICRSSLCQISASCSNVLEISCHSEGSVVGRVVLSHLTCIYATLYFALMLLPCVSLLLPSCNLFLLLFSVLDPQTSSVNSLHSMKLEKETS